MGDSGKFLEKLMSGNEEVKRMLRDIQAKGLSAGPSMMGSKQSESAPFADYGRFRPPVPTVGVDGDISSRFSYKFQSHLDVMDKDGRAGLGEQTKYDVAFMML